MKIVECGRAVTVVMWSVNVLVCEMIDEILSVSDHLAVHISTQDNYDLSSCNRALITTTTRQVC